MNQNLKINVAFAISKAKEAVKSWESALAIQIEAKNAEGIEFCTKSLEACKKNLAAVKKDTEENWTAYL